MGLFNLFSSREKDENKYNNSGIDVGDYYGDFQVMSSNLKYQGYIDVWCDQCQEHYQFTDESDVLSGRCPNSAMHGTDELKQKIAEYYSNYDEEDESGEYLSVYDAALIWQSNGKDEDYTFGFSEDELEDALK